MDPLFWFRARLHGEGRIDLGVLNARVPHRFSGIFVLADGLIVNTHLFDKQRKLVPADLGPVPFLDSFCQFTIREGAFLTDNSPLDERLHGNANQGVVISYHGMPVMQGPDRLFGTLCHFDHVPHELPADELQVLTNAAAEIGRYLSAQDLSRVS